MNSNSDDLVEGISELPLELQSSPRWAAERNKILESLRREAEGLPMSTASDLLIERMATFYSVTRSREADPDAKITAAELKSNTTIWLQLTAEFHKQITVGEDKRRHAMIANIMKIINNALIMVEDSKTREDIRKNLASGFRDAGL